MTPARQGEWTPMLYKNTEYKLDTVITLFKEGRINLSPVFQRGRAWKLRLRQELIKNIARKRPIPAIFLYKTAQGNATAFTVMDGKQRLESILLFVGDGHKNLKISNWQNYFSEHIHWDEGMFEARCRDSKKKIKFADLNDEEIREFREYLIPVIEITLEDETNLDELIALFVDINKNGVPVKREQIIASMKHKDPLLRSVYALVAKKLEKGKTKGKDRFTKLVGSSFRLVLDKLVVVKSAPNNHAKADRMWSKLMELALFIRNGNTHGKGAEVLRKFIETQNNPALTGQETKKLRRVFQFLNDTYRLGLNATKFASDYSQFYILATSLLTSLLPDPIPDGEREELQRKLLAFGALLEKQYKADDPSKVAEFLRLSSRQTTDAKKREDRQKLFGEILATL